MNILIVGCGYLGRRLNLRYQQAGAKVSALVRTSETALQLTKLGVSVQELDLDQSVLELVDIEGSLIFYLAPPPRSGVTDLRVQHFLSAINKDQQPNKLVYLSTTGVYGDCLGDWVDETRMVHPVADRAHRRWSAEQQFQAWGQATGVAVVIMRVAGIYGPGRLPLARLKRGEPMVSETESPYTNRIYIDDLVNVCRCAMTYGETGEVYNVSDGHPGNMAAYFNRVADFANLPRPPQISLDEAQQKLSPGLLSYLKESRRLDNQKMLGDLQVELEFPTLDSGLDAIAKAMTD